MLNGSTRGRSIQEVSAPHKVNLFVQNLLENHHSFGCRRNRATARRNGIGVFHSRERVNISINP